VPAPSLYNQMINEYQAEQDGTRAVNYMAFGWDFIFPEWTVLKTKDFFADLDKKQKLQWAGRVPIMENGDGNVLLLDYSGKASRAGVFFWDHEVHNSQVRLTKTFSKFMNLWERVGFVDLYKLVDQFYVPNKDLLDINSKWGRKLTTSLFGAR
jgi:hypothetical protein